MSIVQTPLLCSSPALVKPTMYAFPFRAISVAFLNMSLSAIVPNCESAPFAASLHKGWQLLRQVGGQISGLELPVTMGTVGRAAGSARSSIEQPRRVGWVAALAPGGHGGSYHRLDVTHRDRSGRGYAKIVCEKATVTTLRDLP